MWLLLSVLLLSSRVLSVHSVLQCDEDTQFLQGDNGSQRCCNKCPAGYRITESCKTSRNPTCEPCISGFYRDEPSQSFYCKTCDVCNGDHMVIKEKCTSTKNVVCGCAEGYKCTDVSCTRCERDYQTITTGPVITKGSPAPKLPFLPPPTTDRVWLFLSVCVACVCLCTLLTCFLLTSRTTPACWRILSRKCGVWPNPKPALPNQCTDEEEVPMPIQEEGKTEGKGEV